MAEEQQVQQEPQQVTTKEPQQVTTKNPNKVKADKRLAEYNHRKREEKKAWSKASELNQYYGIGAVLAVVVIGGLGYCIYRTKKGQATTEQGRESPPPQQPRPQTNKFDGLNLFCTIKMDKKSIINDLYQVAVISVLAVGYSMLGKKILRVTPPTIQKFDLEDTGKLVAIIAASEMTREYLIKQKILPDHINV